MVHVYYHKDRGWKPTTDSYLGVADILKRCLVEGFPEYDMKVLSNTNDTFVVENELFYHEVTVYNLISDTGTKYRCRLLKEDLVTYKTKNVIIPDGTKIVKIEIPAVGYEYLEKPSYHEFIGDGVTFGVSKGSNDLYTYKNGLGIDRKFYSNIQSSSLGFILLADLKNIIMVMPYSHIDWVLTYSLSTNDYAIGNINNGSDYYGEMESVIQNIVDQEVILSTLEGTKKAKMCSVENDASKYVSFGDVYTTIGLHLPILKIPFGGFPDSNSGLFNVFSQSGDESMILKVYLRDNDYCCMDIGGYEIL